MHKLTDVVTSLLLCICNLDKSQGKCDTYLESLSNMCLGRKEIKQASKSKSKDL